MTSAELSMLERTWFPVALSDEVASRRPVPARLLGHDLVVYLTASGVTVAQGHCVHRGAGLWLGQMVDDQLECPYHEWRYDGSGQCVAVPSLPSSSPGSRVALRTYSARQAHGLVWTCLGDPLLAVPSLPPPVTGEWSTVVAPGPYDISTGIRTVTENFRDVSHLPFVHRATLGMTSHGWFAPTTSSGPDGS